MLLLFYISSSHEISEKHLGLTPRTYHGGLGTNLDLFSNHNNLTLGKVSKIKIQWIPRKKSARFWVKIGVKLTHFRTVKYWHSFKHNVLTVCKTSKKISEHILRKLFSDIDISIYTDKPMSISRRDQIFRIKWYRPI